MVALNFIPKRKNIQVKNNTSLYIKRLMLNEKEITDSNFMFDSSK